MVFGGFFGATIFRPDQVSETDDPPPVLITEIQLGGVPLTPAEMHVREGQNTAVLDVPSGREEIAISYAALYFRNPSAVRYRYRLQGLDADWHEAGSDRRVASYTALPVGSYRFEVQARTGRSGWTEPGEALAVTVLPPWWETLWFRVATLAFIAAAAVIAYRIRVGQVSRQYAIRLEERLNERSRIAREIHDSLLQSFQGLILRLQAIHNILPDRSSEAAQMLEVALDRADAAVAEGRDTVSALRSTAATGADLPHLLATLRDEIPQHGEPGPDFALVVEKRPQPIEPLMRDEIFQVAREAVRNAVNHASARKIEIELSFGRMRLVLRVRDDGIGMDETVVASGGRQGHWGLSGMRERAERVGARLTIWSRTGAGTEVELRVPAAVAYARASRAPGV
jgi:signal transduction histidine kinase